MDEKMNSEQVRVPLRDKPLKELNRIAKRPKLDLAFQDLTYSVRDSNTKGGWRQILDSVNGRFRCGELTAIMGPSGAGKTSLLNILAGCVTVGVNGVVTVNNRPREMKIFNKLSSYIMQEDIIQQHLTVKEAMVYAACLKLGAHIEYKDKLAVVDEVMVLLGLEKCTETLSEHLSGGQRKRLIVALELVNNPPVIFLDEPTTGLDNFAIKQCIHLLKEISQLDRTVVCTIHQPPASIFQFFDQVYIVADGHCVYNGSPSQLVPFFSQVGYSCPANNTPADYIIELVHSQPEIVQNFRTAIQDGKTNMRESSDPAKSAQLYDGVYNDPTEIIIAKNDTDFANPFYIQLWILLSRMFLQLKRNTTGLWIQFFHHLLSSMIIGVNFYKIGNDGSQTIPIFKFCMCCVIFFTYTHVMLPVLLFPLEFALLKREYFNRWYSLKAYYTALTVMASPLILAMSIMYVTIVYPMTGQPLESHRIFGFWGIIVVTAFTAQGLGYCLGTVFSITAGSVMAPSVLAPCAAMAIYGMGYRTGIEPFYQFLMKIDFIRTGLEGLTNCLFYQRAPLMCPESEEYCHYSRVDVLMADMGIEGMPYKYHIAKLLISLIVFRVVGFLFLKCRLNNNLKSKLIFYVSKVVKHRD